MERTYTIIFLAAMIVVLESCGSLLHTGHSQDDDTATTDAIVNTSIVGTSNTPGSERTGYFSRPIEATISTANTTGPSPSADDVTMSALSFETQRFIRLVTYNRITEVQLSQYAISRSSNMQLKSYANNLVTVQSRLGDALRAISKYTDDSTFNLDQSAGDELPEKLAKLNQEQDAKFVDTYKKMMTKELRSLIKILEQGRKFKDKAIADFSIQHLPELRTLLKDISTLN